MYDRRSTRFCLALFDGDQFPTYLSHLYGRDVNGESWHFVNSVVLVNSGTIPANVVVRAEMQTYSAVAEKAVVVEPGAHEVGPIDLTFAFDELYAISAPVLGIVQVSVHAAGGNETSLDVHSQAVTVLPKNTVFWSQTAADGSEQDVSAYVATLVTPRDSGGQVDELLTDSAEYSVFGAMVGYLNLGVPLYFEVTVDPAACAYWWSYYFAGQQVALAVDVTCTTCTSYNAQYGVFDEDNAMRWYDGEEYSTAVYNGALGEWSTSFTTYDEGWYLHAACNPESNYSDRTFQVQRTIGSNEEAQDQISAVFGALNARGMKYTTVWEAFFDGAQTVKTPAESLATGSQNCIDGTLVFASALESMGMEPVIFLIPGHAFVGVRINPAPYSSLPDDYLYLPIETTLVSTASAEEAVEKGWAELEQWFGSAEFRSYDIASLRALGVLPAPL